MSSAKCPERHRYDHVECTCRGEADANRASLAPRCPSRRLCRLFSKGRHPLHPFQESFTRRRELCAMGNAVKQQRSDLGLQIPDLLTERGLPYAELGRGAREVALLRDGQEIAG